MATYRAFYISGPGNSWKNKLKLAALLAVGGAILVAAVILSLGLLLVLVPIGLVAYLFRRPILRALAGSMRRRQDEAQAEARQQPVRPSSARPSSGNVTIEAEYTIVDRDSRPRP